MLHIAKILPALKLWLSCDSYRVPYVGMRILVVRPAQPELFLKEITGHYGRSLSLALSLVASSFPRIWFSLQPWKSSCSDSHVKRNESHSNWDICLS